MVVMVISEDVNVRHELIGKARQLADELGTKVAVGVIGPCECEPIGAGAFKSGADQIFMAKPSVAEYNVDLYTEAAVALVAKADPKILLIGSTKDGKEFAGRVAARLDKPLAVDCSDVRLEGGNLVIDRIMYGGNAVSTQEFSVTPSIATVAPKTFDKPEPVEGRTGEVVEVDVTLPSPKVTVVKETEKLSESIDLSAAKVIVSCGRGIKNKEDVQIIQDLAKALNGEVGCSRPIASDLKWLSVDHWVGLSGKKVKPSLYVAIGISGQIQHLAGMRDSKMIIAINKDGDAPIFQAADYGIVGDLYKIVGELTQKLQ